MKKTNKDKIYKDFIELNFKNLNIKELNKHYSKTNSSNSQQLHLKRKQTDLMTSLIKNNKSLISLIKFQKTKNKKPLIKAKAIKIK